MAKGGGKDFDLVTGADPPLFALKARHDQLVLVVDCAIGGEEIGAIAIAAIIQAYRKARTDNIDPIVLGQIAV